MATVTLNDLVTVQSPDDVLAVELSVAQTLGLATTAWQPLGMARTILATLAQVGSNYSNIVNFIAQGGYVSYAALMVDSDGNPVTTWMDLVAKNMFNVDRVPASFASGPVSLVNSSGTPYTFAAGQFHMANATTNQTYTNISNITIAASSTTVVQMKADVAGAQGTSTAGTVLIMVTPLVGVTVSALGVSWVGQDAESNQALAVRCEAKLGSLSPNGPSQAYYFVATTTIPPSGTAINRVNVVVDTVSGVVTVYIANAAGTPSGGDISAINDAIQAQVVPAGVTATVVGATAVSQAVAADVWVPNATGLTSLQIQNACATALATYFSNLPIGGIVDNLLGTTVLPVAEISATIYEAIVKIAPGFSSRIAVQLTNPSADVPLTANEVATLATTTITAHFT